MEEDYLHSIRTLVQSAKSGVDRVCNEEIDKYRGIINKAHVQEKLRQQGQNQLLSKKKELDLIKSLLDKFSPELNSLKREDAELGLRLDAVESDLIERCRKNEATKQKIRELTAEVVDLEYDKENKVTTLKNEYTDLKKIHKIYKTMLDMRIEWMKPDVYKIWFSTAGTQNPPDLVLGSTDLSSWEVLDVGGNEDLKHQLNDDYVEHRNIQSILFQVRQLKTSPLC